MVRTTLSKALFIGCFVTGASVAFAQGTTTETPSTPSTTSTAPTTSNLATKPGQTPDQTPTQSLTDSQITSVLLAANTAEISQGKMAQKTAKSKDVVEFAKQMVNEHTQASKEVKDLNARLKIKEQASAVREQLETAARTSDTRLKGKKGTDFEKTYIDEQVTMHQTVLDTIDTQLAPNAKTEELKTLLTRMRSSVATHLDHAKQLQSSKAAM